MTIQQLEYIAALNKFRHFVTASEQCGITQPTLSLMIQKLEAELNVTIFDRSKHPVEPTSIGQKLIEQAEAVLREVRKMKEIVANETDSIKGPLKIGVIPTLAPYLVPEFIQQFKSEYKQVQLSITEMRTASLVDALKKDQLDMFIAATPLVQHDFLEISLYYEKFVAYFAPDNPYRDIPLSAQNMPNENLWILQEGHCFRSQIFNFCSNTIEFNHAYEAGSIETLIRIVRVVGEAVMFLFRIVQQQAELHPLAGKLAIGQASKAGKDRNQPLRFAAFGERLSRGAVRLPLRDDPFEILDKQVGCRTQIGGAAVAIAMRAIGNIVIARRTIAGSRTGAVQILPPKQKFDGVIAGRDIRFHAIGLLQNTRKQRLGDPRGIDLVAADQQLRIGDDIRGIIGVLGGTSL
jgi:LysR family hydrogen peroxide-inducible transcriptional activator